MRLAIMQPYFIPYAGYFRLFCAADLFVIYDCVQFARRGYVHRNQLPNTKGELSWLTLPLAKAPQDIKISDLAFSPDASARMQEQLLKFPLFVRDNFSGSTLRASLDDFSTSPTEYIVHSLRQIAEALQLPFKIAYSSELKLPQELKNEERIIAIAKHFNASEYVNSPGGKDLYDAVNFKKNNINLKFLTDYKGAYQSILQRLFTENSDDLRHEIISQCEVD
jgi:hypothetical protein